MTEPELDDVAFLTGTGDSNSGRPPREGVAVCSQKRALCVAAIVLGALLGTALVIAYAGPQNDCKCAGKMPPGYVYDQYNSSQPFQPYATNGQPFPWLHPYLPNNVQPNRYMLTIHPNLTTLDVKGQVTIEFYVERETYFIVLHIQDLNITDKGILGPKGFSLKISRMLEYPPRQQLFIEFKDKLRKKSNYTLNLRWYSRLSSEPEGFYVDQYENSKGMKKMLAATVFEPGGARKAFPCFNEPHLRAPFRISVFRDRFHLGLSNSLVQATDDVGFYMGTGLLRDDFIETPPLSPDDIAWVVSDFDRESLEPSTTYQLSSGSGTADDPSNLLAVTENKQSTSTDNLKLATGDKKPNRNISAAFITRGLIHPGYENSQPQPSTTHQQLRIESPTKINVTTSLDHVLGNDSLTVTPITTAPSYTFYASKATLSRYALVLNISRNVLEYLQTWLGVPYPLTKLDFVALPSLQRDLTSSLGLITLRSEFVKDPKAITTKEFHVSGIKVSEAILRQFFGGITSPKVWKHVWLWEGIVRYMGRHALVPLKPTWPMEEMHLVESVNRAMDVDAIQGWESLLNGTSDDGINEQFYVDKSASILAMLHATIGEDSFRRCLGAFLNANRFQTSEPPELWVVCSKLYNGSRNIKDMMNQWTTLAGFPLVQVKRTGDTVTITQTPFQPKEFLAIEDDPHLMNLTTTTTTTTTTPSPNAKKKPLKWIFPVSYTTNNKNVSDTMLMTGLEMTFNVPADTKWIKINTNQTGYYRVLYDNEIWNRLIEVLNSKTNTESFNVKDRIGLISDAFTLCHANILPCQITLDLASYLPRENSWGPMAIGLRHLERWRRILKYSESFLMLTEYVRTMVKKSISTLGWLDLDTDEKRLLRAEVLLSAVLWEEPQAIDTTKKMLNAAINNNTQIPPNLREVAYTGGVLSGEFIYWQYCWDRFTKLQNNKEELTEKMELLRALGNTKDAWLQNRLLTHVIRLPTVEVVQVLSAIAGTPTGGAMACRFLQAKWFELQSSLGAGSIDFARVISAITQYGATKFDYDELKSLVSRFGYGPGMRILSMTLRSVATNVEWVSRSQSAIYSWVENFEKKFKAENKLKEDWKYSCPPVEKSSTSPIVAEEVTVVTDKIIVKTKPSPIFTEETTEKYVQISTTSVPNDEIGIKSSPLPVTTDKINVTTTEEPGAMAKVSNFFSELPIFTEETTEKYVQISTTSVPNDEIGIKSSPLPVTTDKINVTTTEEPGAMAKVSNFFSELPSNSKEFFKSVANKTEEYYTSITSKSNGNILAHISFSSKFSFIFFFSLFYLLVF